MKVYLVESGSYSDRSAEAIFSSKEKAEEWIAKENGVREYDRFLGNPVEYELNETPAPPEEFVFQVVNSELIDAPDSIWHFEYFPGEVCQPYLEEENDATFVKVKFSYDKEQMKETARRILTEWLAKKTEESL